MCAYCARDVRCAVLQPTRERALSVREDRQPRPGAGSCTADRVSCGTGQLWYGSAAVRVSCGTGCCFVRGCADPGVVSFWVPDRLLLPLDNQPHTPSRRAVQGHCQLLLAASAAATGSALFPATAVCFTSARHCVPVRVSPNGLPGLVEDCAKETGALIQSEPSSHGVVVSAMMCPGLWEHTHRQAGAHATLHLRPVSAAVQYSAL